jgi:hypothetical protein
MGNDLNSLKKELRLIAKEHGIKVIFVRNLECSGLAYCLDGRIYVRVIDRNRILHEDNKIITTFFHEVGHVICYRRGRYKMYNSGYFSYKHAKKYALKAERAADTAGSKMCKKYYPNMKWKKSYFNKSDAKWLEQWIERSFDHERD